MNASTQGFLESRFPFEHRIISPYIRYHEVRIPTLLNTFQTKIYNIYSGVAPTEAELIHQGVVEGFITQIIDPLEPEKWQDITHRDWTKSMIESLIREVFRAYFEVFIYDCEMPKLLCYVPVVFHDFLYYEYQWNHNKELLESFQEKDIWLIPLHGLEAICFLRWDDLTLVLTHPMLNYYVDHQTNIQYSQASMNFCFIHKPIWALDQGKLYTWGFKIEKMPAFPEIDPEWFLQYQSGDVDQMIELKGGNILL
jgi:hypothetical protein